MRTQHVTAEKEKQQQSFACVAAGTHVWSEKKRFCIHVFQIHVFGVFLVSFVSSPKAQVLPAVLIYVLFELAPQPLTWQSWRGEREVFKLKSGNISLALHPGLIVESNPQILASVLYI